MIFDLDSFFAEDIREDREYKGKRVSLIAYLAKARMKIQVDVGFGDAVTPQPAEVEYPTILGMPAPRIRAYPMETVVSEKTQTVVHLGIQNSRMKDYYDLWILSKSFPFKGETLVQAIKATFERRKTKIPKDVPVGLSDDFSMDEDKHKQWKAFLSRIGLTEHIAALPDAIEALRAFLVRPLQAAAHDTPFPLFWRNGGPWSE